MRSCSFVSGEQQPVDLEEEMTQILADALFDFLSENRGREAKDGD